MNLTLPVPDLVTDLHGLNRLQAAAREAPQDAQTLRAVASQFEALFVQMMLKSLREASFGDPLLGEQGEHYRDLFDQQIAMNLAAGRGLGLAEILARQLSPAAGASSPSPTAPERGRFDSPQAFVQGLWPHAQRAAQRLGVAPDALIAQAALESGWGERVIHGPDGRNSFNVFGIKADSAWRGARVSVPTLEFVAGVAERRHAVFRSYESYAEAFDDYADFLETNPRYRNALAKGGETAAFLEALQKAGYATDPRYAEKIRSILRADTLTSALKSAPAAPLTS